MSMNAKPIESLSFGLCETPQTRGGQQAKSYHSTGLRPVSETFAILHGILHEDILEKVYQQPVKAKPPHERQKAEQMRLMTTAKLMQTEVQQLCSVPILKRSKRKKKKQTHEEMLGKMDDSGPGFVSRPGIPELNTEQANNCFTVESDLRPTSQVILRGLKWKVLLGALSKDCRSWNNDTQQQRSEYANMSQHFLSGVRKNLEDVIENSSSETSKKKAKKDLEAMDKLQDCIDRDVKRTYPDKPFFTQPHVRDMMRRILFIYANLNPNLEYVQGMNEILAPLLYVLDTDQERVSYMLEFCHSHINELPSIHLPGPEQTSEMNPSELWTILEHTTNKDYLEADAYTLFNQIMLVIGKWFESPKMSSLTGGFEQETEEQSEEWKLTPVKQAPIETKCLEIQKLLLAKDYDLAVYLQELNIQPQLYMLRWVRILFSQVFPLDDILFIWDAIFSTGEGFCLVDHLCVTVLSLIRTHILGGSYSDVLSALFHYPARETPTFLVISIAQNSFRSGINPFFVPLSLAQPENVRMPNFFPPTQINDDDKLQVVQPLDLKCSASPPPPQPQQSTTPSKPPSIFTKRQKQQQQSPSLFSFPTPSSKQDTIPEVKETPKEPVKETSKKTSNPVKISSKASPDGFSSASPASSFSSFSTLFAHFSHNKPSQEHEGYESEGERSVSSSFGHKKSSSQQSLPFTMEPVYVSQEDKELEEAKKQISALEEKVELHQKTERHISERLERVLYMLHSMRENIGEDHEFYFILKSAETEIQSIGDVIQSVVKPKE